MLLQCRRPQFYSWVWRILWERERIPTLVFWPREFHGLYSPWGHRESDMTVLEFILYAKIYILEFIIIKNDLLKLTLNLLETLLMIKL